MKRLVHEDWSAGEFRHTGSLRFVVSTNYRRMLSSGATVSIHHSERSTSVKSVSHVRSKAQALLTDRHHTREDAETARLRLWM